MVMEYITGRALRDVLVESRPMSGPRTARIARQVASGLAHAHERGLVHRDVKPANIMIQDHDGTDHAKLLDFGVVGSLATGGERLTKADLRVGTPLYMAPEQLESSAIGPAADLYALGVSMYEMIAGVPPYTGDSIKIYADKLSGPPPMLVLATGLEALIFKLLAPDPAARPASAREVIAVLDELLETRYARQSRPMPVVKTPDR
jgi:serine/threonine-protein kinase